MKIGSLFAGIGGFDLAAKWMGWETAWYSEIEPYACAVMHKHFPGAVNHGDITHIDGRSIEHVDLLCGGFPCQDISLAGKGAGIEGSRSGLWTHYARLIGEIRPKWVVIENVSALRARGLDQVLGALAALGYDAEWHCIPAAYVGAPHRRDRVWIVAWRTNTDEPRSQGWLGALVRECAGEWAARAVGASVADTDSDARLERRASDAGEGTGGRHADRGGIGANDLANAERSEVSHDGSGEVVGAPSTLQREAPERKRIRLDAGERHHPVGAEWWLTEPNVGRVAHGVPARVDRLRCLGNAIVPQVAYLIFQAIERAEVSGQDNLRLMA